MSRSFQVVPAVSMQPALLPSQGNAQRLLLRLDLHSAQVHPWPCALALPPCSSCCRTLGQPYDAPAAWWQCRVQAVCEPAQGCHQAAAWCCWRRPVHRAPCIRACVWQPSEELAPPAAAPAGPRRSCLAVVQSASAHGCNGAQVADRQISLAGVACTHPGWRLQPIGQAPGAVLTLGPGQSSTVFYHVHPQESAPAPGAASLQIPAACHPKHHASCCCAARR